jgi:hypothetical protein
MRLAEKLNWKGLRAGRIPPHDKHSYKHNTNNLTVLTRTLNQYIVKKAELFYLKS